MPRYYVPPAPGTSPVRPRSAWPWPLLVVGGLLLLGLLLTPPGYQVLGIVAAGALILLYLLLLYSPWLLGFGLLLYALSRLDRPQARRRPPRPAPTWRWQPWEVVLSLAAVLLAVCYYAVADGSRWLRRRWCRRPRRASWKVPQPA